MNKKFLWLALATGLMTVAAQARADSLLEKIATVILADKFGIDNREVVVLREQTNLPVYQLAPIYEGAYYFKRSPSTIWQLRNQGLGWGEIAHRVGMHPGTFNKLRKQGAFDRDRFWTTSYQDRFGVPTQRIEVMRKSGGSLEDVLGAIIVGKLTKTDPSQVYDRFQTERSWTTISNTSNVRFEDWRRVSTPVRTRYVIVDTSKSKTKIKGKWNQDDHGKSKGKGSLGKGKGGGPEKGVAGKGKGGGPDKGQGKGNSKGGSKGNSKGKGKGG